MRYVKDLQLLVKKPINNIEEGLANCIDKRKLRALLPYLYNCNDTRVIKAFLSYMEGVIKC